jgi:di/tricarboxylate transporter
MNPIYITLILLLVAVVLFATEKIPVDVVGILLVIGLILTGVLTAQEGLAGFGDDIIITIGGLFILTGGLVKTGLVDLMGRKLYRIAGDNEFILTMVIMLAAAALAAVLKNTTTTAMLLPVVIGLAERARIPPSKLLMPLAFGAILGGTCTLIGTSTNLAVSGAMKRLGEKSPEQFGDKLHPYSMFELSTVGIMIAVCGIIYMLFIGIRLLPKRGGEDSLTEQYHIREYVTEVLVLPNSPFINKTIAESNINKDLELSVIGIIRGKDERITPTPKTRIRMNDLLIVEGKVSDILRIKSEAGLEIKPDFHLNDVVLESGEVELFEVMIMRDSNFVGQTLKTLSFRQNYDLTVLAINRHGETIIETLSSTPLQFGDVLLAQGKIRLVEPLVSNNELLLLEEISKRSVRSNKQQWALAAFGLFILLSLSKYYLPIEVPLVIAVLLGVMLLLATKTIRYAELYSLIDFRLLVLIACMISFGTAMEKTQADVFLADFIKNNFEHFGPTAVLAGFYVLTVVLTQPMSNQAAALVVLPVAVKTAVALGLNPRTFAIAITYAASSSFLTPLEPACVLVYTPGRYRFFDFVKIGSILTVIVFVITILLVPIFWKM